MGSRGTARAGTFYNLYRHLCLETVFPALKPTQNCYLHYKSANLIVNWLLWSHMSSYWKTTLTIWPDMKASGQKFQTFYRIGENLEIQSKLFKNPNFPSLHELRKTWKYTQPQTNISKSKCWLYGWVGKTYVLI